MGYKKVLKHNIDEKNTDFFINGGNSIKAMELVNYLSRKYGYTVTIDTIFKNPTINKLALYIAQYLFKNNSFSKQSPVVEKVTQQLGIFLLSQKDLGGTSYNMPICYAIQGKIDFLKLKRAYRKIQERYDIFRTIYYLEGNELIEKVLDEPIVEFQVFGSRNKSLPDIFQEFVSPFSLDMLPLTRMGIWEDGNKCYIFFDFHHIISDGISLEIFLGILSEYYTNECFDSYIDVPRKNIHILKSLDNQKKYWLGIFDNFENSTEITGDYPRKVKRTYIGNTIFRKIPDDLCLKVKEVGIEYGCTEFMVYLSTYMILLSIYSMKQEITVGIPVAGRTSTESENALGMFVNTLVVKENIAEKQSFSDLLCAVKKQLLDAYANQDYPFYQLISDLGLSGQVSENPLFNNFFIYQNYEHNAFFLDNKEMKEVRGLDKISKFDLTLEIYPEKNDTFACLEYSIELYKDSTAERILTHYLELLKNIVSIPTTKITKVKYINHDEEALIKDRFSGSKEYKYQNMHFADLFEQNITRFPEATAVIYNTEKLTYKELNSKGNAVASLLRKKMQQDNCIIPFISSRGIEMIVGIIGIHKANYAFMNLDYTLPVERLKFMLDECGAKCVLVGKINNEIAKLIRKIDKDIIYLDMDDIEEENISIKRKSNSLSYIMYTSGTTGKPKGVMIENNGLVAYCQYIGERYHFTINTAVLQSTTYTFDPFIVETMPALLFGSKIIIADENMILVPAYLANYMNEQAVNIVDFCPTVLSRIADYLGSVKSLSIIMSGGEILPNDLKDKLVNNGIRLFNHYGPTEITVDATIQECSLEKNVTLGSPLPFKKIVIVSNGNMAGIGVPGEICISGVGIARGYLNQKESTTATFIQDKEGKIWYKTGDIGKWNEEGEIVYLGRVDKQVKILGHRIELSEIEECIRSTSLVKDLVVINKSDNLIAYYVCDGKIDELILQETLRKSLPFYMIPNVWLQIESIPYTINGKVDIQSLPEVTPKLPKLNEKPFTELELLISDIFSDILEVQKITKYDNFFKQGGNSLKAAILLNRIKKETQYSISLSDFFENPTVDGLCNIINALPVQNSLKNTEFNIEQCNNNILLATPQQKRLFIIQYNNPDYTGYNLTRCFLFRNKIDIGRMANILNDIIKKNESLRTNFILEENEVYQVIRDDIHIDIIIKDLENVSIENEVAAFIKPFDLSKDHLIRVKIIRTKSEEFILFDIHHIISDGISIEMFLKDIFGAYCGTNIINNRNQYRDYSNWISKKNIRKEEIFWRTKLAGIIERTEIYTDFKQSTNFKHSGNVIRRIISSELTQQIKEFCILNRCSEYAFFITTFFILINRYCLNEKLLVASPFSGRTDEKYENVLGFFANTLLICESVSENEIFIELLNRVKNNIWTMQDNQNYPYESMCNYLGIEKGQSMDSITDILFVMQNMDGLSELPKYIQEIEVLVNPEIDFKIIIEVQEERDCYKIFLTYASELYEKTNIEFFLSHYLNILNNAIPNCNKKVKYISEQDDNESKLVVLKGKNIELLFSSVTDIFAHISEAYYNCLAIFDNEIKLTYAELNNKIDKFSAFLYGKGLRKGDRLIIYSEKSIEAIIAIMACYKVGIVYIPIDIEWPIMRINNIINIAKIKYLLLISTMQYDFEKVLNINNSIIYYPYNNLDKFQDSIPHIDVSSYDPAYIIFTSGTSGNPKGVQVSQEGIINLWQQNQAVKHITSKDRILQFSSLSFDALISELTMSILSGASLAIVKEKYRRDLVFISNYIIEKKITVGIFPPHIVGAIPIEALRCVITAGEVIDNIEYNRIVNAGCDYWNEYGPTEGTVCTSMWNYKEGRTGDHIPIGSPICNVNVSIIKDGKILGIGMIGEIYIEGKNVADGYLEGDKLGTRFQKGDKRCYYTGDIGRILPNGVIDFLGRKDNQVKINGYRIELEEIENAIKMDTNICEAAAFVNKNPKSKELVLVFVSKEDVDLRNIRNMLAKRLPIYMIPNRIQRVENIPLTTNGKVDVVKLESIVNNVVKCKEKTISVESVEILDFIREILKREDINENDNFFSLGGSSIEAAFLINKIYKTMGKKISYYNFAMCKDIFELCELVEATTQNKEGIIEQKEKNLMSNAEKQIYLASIVDDRNIYNMPHSYRISKAIDIGKLKKAFSRIVDENEKLHTIFYEDGGNYYKKVLSNYLIDFKYQEVNMKLTNYDIKKFIRNFDLEKDSLIRMIIVRELETYLLFLDAHHIIFDKSSWDCFFKLLKEYYLQSINEQI